MEAWRGSGCLRAREARLPRAQRGGWGQSGGLEGVSGCLRAREAWLPRAQGGGWGRGETWGGLGTQFQMPGVDGGAWSGEGF